MDLDRLNQLLLVGFQVLYPAIQTSWLQNSNSYKRATIITFNNRRTSLGSALLGHRI